MNRKMMRLAIEGQGLVEYGLIILLIAIAAIGLLSAFGTAVFGNITSSATALFT